MNDVVEAIYLLREKYFFDLSQPIYRLLPPVAQKLFEEKFFIDLFNTLIKENKLIHPKCIIHYKIAKYTLNNLNLVVFSFIIKIK